MDDFEARRRDAINLLMEEYAQGVLTLHQYEDRREAVLAARSLAEIDHALYSEVDTAGTHAPVPSSDNSVLCIMGDRKIAPPKVDAPVQTTCIMGDVTVDLRKTILAGPVYITTVTLMGDTTIHVPKNARVHNGITAILADVKEKRSGRSKADEDDPARDGEWSSTTPEIHLSGVAIMADVKIKRA